MLYLQSCLEWTLRMQMNLILLLFFYALLDQLNANWRRLKGEYLESTGKGGARHVGA